MVREGPSRNADRGFACARISIGESDESNAAVYLMFYGHVDNVSRQQIEGWAADDGAPEQPIDISILVNGRKVAQVACNHPREDLRRTRQYGTGNHGFLFQFAEPLSEGTEARVTVLFSETGCALVRGDWMLDAEGANSLDPAEALPVDEPVMMPAPRDPRALFELLLWYHERAGLYPLFSRLDVAGLPPQHIHYGVLGRYPDRTAAPRPQGRYYPRDDLNELILGDEFQSGLLPRLAEAYRGQAATDLCAHSEMRRHRYVEQAQGPLSMARLQHHG